MTLEIACPHCSSRIKAPDNVMGKQVRCPKCRNSFTAQAPPENEPVDDPFSGYGAAPPISTPAPPSMLSNQASFESVPATSPALPTSGMGSPLRANAAQNTLVDYLMFRRMITPVIILIVFYLGVFLMLLTAMGMGFLGLYTMTGSDKNAVGLGLTYMAAGFGMLLSILPWRIYWEFVTIFFNISEILADIRDQNRKPS